jgi:hypothetical protein
MLLLQHCASLSVSGSELIVPPVCQVQNSFPTHVSILCYLPLALCRRTRTDGPSLFICLLEKILSSPQEKDAQFTQSQQVVMVI